MANCIYCNAELSEERIKVERKNYCKTTKCITQHVTRDSFESKYRLVLMPKQGYTYVSVDDPILKQGRSSGR